MSKITITQSWIHPPGKTPVLQLVFQGEAISSRKTYVLRDKPYWLDELPFDGHPITRANMATQALRRIDGIGEITVKHDVLTMQVAPDRIATNAVRQRFITVVKNAVEVALTASTPWATHSDGVRPWSYHFGDRLVQNGHGIRHAVRADSPHLTELARRIVTGREWQQINMTIDDIWSHHLFVISRRTVTPFELTQGHDAIAANVGKRRVTLAWSNSS